MQYNGTAQTIQLTGLDQGHEVTVIITGANAVVNLEFKHGTEDIWRPHPSFTAVAAAAVNLLTFRILSGVMRIRFDTVPSTYELTTVVSVDASF